MPYIPIIRYVGVIRLLFLSYHLYLIGMWLGENQKHKHHRNIFLRDLTVYLNLINFSTINDEHSGEDMCIL